MVVKEISTELSKIGNDFAITLPASFCEGTTLVEGVDLKVVYNDRGNLEIEVNRVVAEEELCEVCKENKARFHCVKCGVHACSKDFWEWGGTCNGCTGE